MVDVNQELCKLIKEAQGDRGQNQFAQQCGISSSAITRIFTGSYVPSAKTLQKIALKAYNGVTYEMLMNAAGYLTYEQKEKAPAIKDEVELNDTYPIPLLGSVVAGTPIEAQEDLECYIYIGYRPAEEYFALRVHGDSMKNAGIQDNSILVVHKQDIAENGDIVVAMLNKEQTVKRFKLIGNTMFLMPENPNYDPIPVSPTDELLILGKVVEVRFSF